MYDKNTFEMVWNMDMNIFKQEFCYDNYLGIPSLKYENKIKSFFLRNCLNLPFDLFSLCIEYNGNKIYLGNYSKGVIVPYSFPHVNGADPVFVIAKSTSVFNYSDIKYESEVNKVLKEMFQVNNYMSIYYNINNISITAVFSGLIFKSKYEIDLIIQGYLPRLKEFIFNFICYMKEEIIEYHPRLKYLHVFKENNKLKNIILSRNKSNDIFLSDKELELLFLYKIGRTENEISKEINLSSQTVKTYLKNIRIKIGAKNTREAIYMVENNGYIL